jgi:hypothetical protein
MPPADAVPPPVSAAASEQAEPKAAEAAAVGAAAVAAGGIAAAAGGSDRHEEPVAVGHAAPVERSRSARGGTGHPVSRAVRTVLSLLASLIKLIGTVAALILIIYIVFVVGQANPANKLTGFITEWAHRLNLGLDGLFRPPGPDLTVLVNYGVAALVWFLVCVLVARVLRKL